MLRFNSVYLVTALTIVTVSECAAQSSTRGSGTIINSTPSQPYRSQPIQRQPYQGQINSQGSGSSMARPAQGSSSMGSSVRTAPETFEDKFWKYLSASRYKNWAPVPGKTGDTYAGQSPHGATLRMYLNRTAAGRPKEMPDNSIIVKENYGPDGKRLMAITVMYRTKGFNPPAGDWYWIKYRPDGTVDEKAVNGTRMKLSGKPNGCIECHAGAEGGDFAFFNDNM